jgi:hypothetical protein
MPRDRGRPRRMMAIAGRGAFTLACAGMFLMPLTGFSAISRGHDKACRQPWGGRIDCSLDRASPARRTFPDCRIAKRLAALLLTASRPELIVWRGPLPRAWMALSH